MKEQHEQQFRGVWIPADIWRKMEASEISLSDVILLALIDSLVTSDKGCFATNAYLASRTSRGLTQTRESVAKLLQLGLLRVVKFDGRRRYLETAWSRVDKGEKRQSAGKSGRQSAGNPAGALILTKTSNMSGAGPPDSTGFGMVAPSNGDTTAFDVAAATKLLEICRRHLGPSHPNLRRARVDVWARHFRLLRLADHTTEDRITKAMEWYGRHIGEEFTPEAFAGESFRKKFPAIERASLRDVTTTEISPAATKLTQRLVTLGWPGGMAEGIPGTVQLSLTAYKRWVRQLNEFLTKLRNKGASRNAEECGFLKFGEYLVRIMPAPGHFVGEWMKHVHKQTVGRDPLVVCELGPYVFAPKAKRFRSMGRGCAGAYANDPDRWDRFIEAMQQEQHAH